MSVSNGQNASDTIFNQAFLSRLQDTSTVGKLGLLRPHPEDGAPVLHVQQQINALLSFLGQAGGGAIDDKPTWTSNVAGTETDSVKERADALTALFSLVGGHSHSGVEGDGGPISLASIIDFIGTEDVPIEVGEEGLEVELLKPITFAFVKGAAGAVTVTGTPQITGGLFLNILVLIGADSAAPVTFQEGSGLILNGDCELVEGSVLALVKLTDVFLQLFRNDIIG